MTKPKSSLFEILQIANAIEINGIFTRDAFFTKDADREYKDFHIEADCTFEWIFTMEEIRSAVSDDQRWYIGSDKIKPIKFEYL